MSSRSARIVQLCTAAAAASDVFPLCRPTRHRCIIWLLLSRASRASWDSRQVIDAPSRRGSRAAATRPFGFTARRPFEPSAITSHLASVVVVVWTFVLIGELRFDLRERQVAVADALAARLHRDGRTFLRVEQQPQLARARRGVSLAAH